MKKYCECYQSGVKCTSLCKCEGCKNCEQGIGPLNLSKTLQAVGSQSPSDSRLSDVVLQNLKDLSIDSPRTKTPVSVKRPPPEMSGVKQKAFKAPRPIPEDKMVTRAMRRRAKQ